jgi:hypothetical protein
VVGVLLMLAQLSADRPPLARLFEWMWDVEIDPSETQGTSDNRANMRGARSPKQIPACPAPAPSLMDRDLVKTVRRDLADLAQRWFSCETQALNANTFRTIAERGRGRGRGRCRCRPSHFELWYLRYGDVSDYRISSSFSVATPEVYFTRHSR